MVWWLARLPLNPKFKPSQRRYLFVARLLSEGKQSHLPHIIRFYGMLKTLEVWKKILRKKHSRTFLAKFLLLPYYVSLLVTARELWWIYHE
jgi:hypothetical protein